MHGKAGVGCTRACRVQGRTMWERWSAESRFLPSQQLLQTVTQFHTLVKCCKNRVQIQRSPHPHVRSSVSRRCRQAYYVAVRARQQCSAFVRQGLARSSRYSRHQQPPSRYHDAVHADVSKPPSRRCSVAVVKRESAREVLTVVPHRALLHTRSGRLVSAMGAPHMLCIAASIR